jgi:iron complex outermembrane receptor protein
MSHCPPQSDGKTRESGEPGDLPKSFVLNHLRGKIQESSLSRDGISPVFLAKDRAFVLNASLHNSIVLAFLLCVGNVHDRARAQSDSSAFDDSDRLLHPDSSAEASAYALGEIVVTATRNQTSAVVAPSSVSVLTRAHIAAMPGNLLSSALSIQAGLFVRSYGGGSALQTISLRGMGPEHTLVLVDGQRHNSLQNGQSDFGLFSNSNVERVEIVRGGYSALYGADAVGGVINIVTRKPSEWFTGYIHSTLGANNLSANEIGISGTSLGGLGYRILARREHSRGNYEFEFSDGQSSTLLRRNGEDFSSWRAETQLEYAFASDVHSALAVSYADINRGVGGPVTDAQAVGTARMSELAVRTQSSVEWSVASTLSLQCRSQFAYSFQTYKDAHLLIDGKPLDSRYLNRAWSVTPELRLNISPGFSGSAGLEIMRGWIESNEVLDKIRWQRSAFISTQHIVPLETVMPFDIAVYPSIRYDSFSDVRADISPRIGVNMGLVREPELRVRSSYGKNFRAPTFNDLYWREGGNPNLKPERSLSFDAGIIAALRFFGLLHLEANYFSIETRDRIVWTPGSSGLWSPKNIAAVESNGAEAEARWLGYDGTLAFTLNSTWMTTTKQNEDYPNDPTKGKQLVYVPRQTVNATLALQLEGINFFLQHSWTSFRYTTEVNDRFLPQHRTTSAAATYALLMPIGSNRESRVSLKLEVTNLFNESYQVIALYPMPLREWRGTVGVEL